MTVTTLAESPRLMQALEDLDAADVLKRLQMHRTPLTVMALSRETGKSVVEVLGKLDLLEEVGLVVKKRASRQIRHSVTPLWPVGYGYLPISPIRRSLAASMRSCEPIASAFAR